MAYIIIQVQYIAGINGAHWKSQRMVACQVIRSIKPLIYSKWLKNLVIRLSISEWTLSVNIYKLGCDFNAVLDKNNDWVTTYEAVNKGNTELGFLFTSY